VHPLLLLPLSPLLLLQGAYVRKVTPRLPEASGARAGEAGTGPALRLLILGDSAAAGVGVETQQQALTGQLVERLADGLRLRWKLWAANGRTSARCIALLEERAAETFDAAVISLGVNDVTGGVHLADWLAQQARIRAVLRAKFGVRRIVLTAVPPMQHFRALPQPLRWALGERARCFNQALARSVSDEADVRVLAVAFPPDGDYLAADGFHPNAAAYARWAEEAERLIRELAD